MSKLTNVVDDGVLKEPLYNELSTKVKAIDTSKFVFITQYDSGKKNLEKDIGDVENKISDNSVLATSVAVNAKATEITNKIPNISNLVTTAKLNTKTIEIENKIPDITSLVTTPVLNTKAAEI